MVRVAIADDSAEDLARINRYIERYCAENGIRLSCVSFSDGEDLLEQEQRHPFDLLLLDVEMQWSNGIDVARTSHPLKTVFRKRPSPTPKTTASAPGASAPLSVNTAANF